MPRGLYFSKALSEGLIDGGKFAFQIWLGYPSNWKGNLVFCVTSLGGGGGLIFGGAYTWRGLFSEFYGILILCKICIFMWQNFIVYSLTCFLYLLVCLTLTCQNEVLVTQSILVEIVILFFLQKNCLDSQVLLRRNNGTFALLMFLHLVTVLKGNSSFTFPYFFYACNFT